MEDVLEIYPRPEGATHPVVCVDETSKQHIKETRQPLRIAEGIPSRYDYEYVRNGVSNLFMIFAPLQGFRHVQVTDRRTSIDFAHICQETLKREVRAWQDRRNQQRATVKWQFTTNDARIKLKRLYPSSKD